MRKGEKRGSQRPDTQSHSQSLSKKERNEYRIEKEKSPEAKGRWDNLS